MPLFDATPTNYREVMEIARGGMGSVSLVVRDHGHFERLYARKRLHESSRDDDAMRSMFLDEARIAGLIRHPNVVSVTDVGEDDEGPYLVMDYVDGVSLSRFIQRIRKAGREMPLATALEIVRQIAAGLQAAHELTDPSGERLQVIHRDVSPQNVLLGFDGYARLTDFGIAKALGRSSKTQTGMLKGKFGYMAPEVLRFEDPVPQSDLFSLGVVLYEALTCERLYPSSEGPAAARAILNDPPPDVADAVGDAPDALVELMFSLLAKDPKHRPASAGEVEATLRRILGEVTEDVPPPPLARLLEELCGDERRERAAAIEAARNAKPAGSKRGAWVAAGVAAVALIGAGVAFALVDTTPDAEPVAPPPIAASPEPVEEPEPVVEPDLGVPEETTAEPSTMRRRRPRRRASMNEAIAPMWDWQ
ncbi:MAG: serine/threonine protein kinase [Deltaproteobacteria bacterium]|nr:serine/threonine protein kinase [Deltaproteobacteria bacterium]